MLVLAGHVLVSAGLLHLLLGRWPGLINVRFLTGTLVLMPTLVVASHVLVFCGAVIVATAHARFAGQPATASDGTRRATDRLTQLVAWTTLSLIVGTLLHVVAGRFGVGGRILDWALVVAWSLVTVFIIPVSVIEGISIRQGVPAVPVSAAAAAGEMTPAEIGIGRRTISKGRLATTIIGGLLVIACIEFFMFDRVLTWFVLVLGAALLVAHIWLRRRFPTGYRWSDPRVLRRPPGTAFHLMVVVPAATLLGSHSVPGVNWLLWGASMFLLGIAVIVWMGRALAYAVAKVRRRAEGSGLWLLVAPLGAMLALASVIFDAPLQLRWALSRSAFDVVVEQEGDDAVGYFGDRIGLYEITDVRRVGDAVIFNEATGGFISTAGFAYLPDGPFPELEDGSFESPQFRHIGGNWYAWIASW